MAFSAEGLPPFATLTPSGNTASLDISPTASDVGNSIIKIKVTDDGSPNLSTFQMFTLDVLASDTEKPVIAPGGASATVW